MPTLTLRLNNIHFSMLESILNDVKRECNNDKISKNELLRYAIEYIVLRKSDFIDFTRKRIQARAGEIAELINFFIALKEGEKS